jgi:hypothetical protein
MGFPEFHDVAATNIHTYYRQVTEILTAVTMKIALWDVTPYGLVYQVQ